MENSELLPAVFQGDSFGSLIDLPSVYKTLKDRLSAAQAYGSLQLKGIALVDMKTADTFFVEGFMTPIRGYRQNLTTALDEVEAIRKPHTQKMDAIKSLLMEPGKGFEALIEEAKSWETKWELEKLDRARTETQAKEKKINKAVEYADLRSRCISAINEIFAGEVLDDSSRMFQAAESKTLGQLPGYRTALGAWSPEYATDASVLAAGFNIAGKYHTSEEIAELKALVAKEAIPNLKAEYAEKMNQAKQTTLKYMSDRAAAGADATKVDFAALAASDVADRVHAELSHKDEVANIEAQAETIAAQYSEPASPMLTKAKNVAIRKAYRLQSHQAFAEVMKQWVAREMGLYTIEELTKKLSFMITSANKRLNEGETLEAPGLIIFDDVNPKVQRK